LLAVVEELNEPQSEDPHVTDQLTPSSWLSFCTVAAKEKVPFGSIEAGGVPSVTTIPVEATMGRTVLAVAEGSAVTVAVIVTLVPTGIVAGAV
jgi:hypothetical protein